MKQRTYLLIDVGILTVVACVLESVNILLLKRVFTSEIFSLSLIIPMCAILQMRWRWAAAPMLVLSATVFCLCQNAVAEQYAIYIVGNLFAMACLVWFIALPHRRISNNVWLALAFTLSVGLMIVVGRAVMAAVFGHSFFSYLRGFAAVEAANIVIGMLIVFVVWRQKTLFLYQPDYLKDIAKEREQELKRSSEIDVNFDIYD